MSDKLERCPVRSPGGVTENGTLPKGKQCGLPKGHDGDHTLLIPSGVPWEKTTSEEAPKGEMNDRELLELAAQAAGKVGFFVDAGLNIGSNETPIIWNTLKSDADAFRLMVDLGMKVLCDYPSGVDKVLGVGVLIKDELPPEFWQAYGKDKRAATREGITRAAAAVGKGMR